MKGFFTKKVNIISSIAIAIVVCLVAILSIVKIDKSNSDNLDVETLRTLTYAKLTDTNTYYLNDQDEQTDACEFVEFGAFFTGKGNDGRYADKILGSCKGVGDTAKIYFEVKVNREGTLKNGAITWQGTNAQLSVNALKDQYLKDNCVFSNKSYYSMSLNDMEPGSNLLLIGNISKYGEMSKVNKAVFTGTYVDDGGVEHPIKKEIELTVDWYGVSKASLSHMYNTVYYGKYKAANGSIAVSFNVEETKKELTPSYFQAELKIPELAGEYPESIEVFGETYSESSENDLIENQYGTYDKVNHVLTIKKNTAYNNNSVNLVLNYSENVYNQVSSTEQTFNGYTLRIPVTAFYACVNNPNEGFINPYISQSVSGDITVNFDVESEGGSRYGYKSNVFFNGRESYSPTKNQIIYTLSKDKLIRAYEKELNFDYGATWTLQYSGGLKENCSFVLKEGDDDEIDGESIIDYVNVTGIYFSNDNFIGTDDYVRVYNDETDELIKEFNYDDITKTYKNAETAYTQFNNVRKIRVETSEHHYEADGGFFTVSQLKQIDTSKMKEDYSIEDLSEAEFIKTHINVQKSNQSYLPNGSDLCYLETARNEITLTNTVGDPDEDGNADVRIVAYAPYRNNRTSEWKNGTFYVVLPELIQSLNYNDLTDIHVTTSSSDVNIVGYEYDEDQNAIMIITENEVPTSGFSIIIEANAVLSPVKSGNIVTLYADNEYCKIHRQGTKDIYDINSDGSTEDYVCVATTALKAAAVSGGFASEVLTLYDSNDEGISITTPPTIADVDSTVDYGKIDIQIVNNYGMKMKNVVVLGKIPYKNNTYINGNDMGSKFDTTMRPEGIKTTERGKAPTVYYSEKENPTRDVNDAENGWKLKSEVSSFENIKSYLVIVNQVIYSSDVYTLSYKIDIPRENVELNDRAYSCHVVYYDLDTEDGLLASTIQPRKLGMRIADFYDLDLTKLKKNTERAVKGATYQISEVLPADADEDYIAYNRIKTSTADGSFSFKKLRINAEYTLKEIRANNNYELNENEIRFKLEKNEQGELNFVTLSNNGFDGEMVIGSRADGRPTVSSVVEDTPKYRLKINKLDKENDQPMKHVEFTVGGNNYITDARGIITTDSLSLGQQYTLNETKNEGYYIDLVNVPFTVKYENNQIVVESDNEVFQNAVVTNNGENDLAEVEITIKNEKIPTYDLRVLKVNEENETEKLAGAVFLVTHVDDNRNYLVETDAEGKIDFTGLYQYVEGKSITGEYILKEEKAPKGFVKNNEEIKFKVKKVNDQLVMEIDNVNSLSTVKDVVVNENTLTLTIKDRPAFRLVKKDKTTGEPLKNATFKIIDTSTNDYAKDADGSYLGTLNENGEYVFTTNDNGVISLLLPDGTYRAVEVGYPEGYMETPNSEVFTISNEEQEYMQYNEFDTSSIGPAAPSAPTSPYVEFESTHELEDETYDIEKIEDLVQFAIDVKTNPDSFANKKVKLLNDLDFTIDADYRDPSGTSFGDINGDETIEDIKTELTTGAGFPGIGTYDGTDAIPFKGVFDGNNKKISNLYIDKGEGSYGGFFVATNNAEIYDFELTGTVNATSYGAGLITYAAGTTNMENVKLNVTVTTTGTTAAGMISYTDGSCYFNQCLVDGSITGTNYTAGYVATFTDTLADGADRPLISIENSTSSAAITGQENTAGLIADTGVANSYLYKNNVTGTIKGTSKIAGGIANIGNGTTGYVNDITVTSEISKRFIYGWSCSMSE